MSKVTAAARAAVDRLPVSVDRGDYWRIRLARWRSLRTAATPGYTLLVPVPGDIPVFLELALKVLARQAADERVETVVLPDRLTPTIRQIVREAQPSWRGPLRLQPLPPPERWFLPAMKSGSRNHGMQVVAGVEAAAGSHVVLHDADLFLLDAGLLDDQYRHCRDGQLACTGVSPVWDGWYATHGLHLAATWEMVASTAWIRRFPPYRHIGHDAELFGETHTFDTTLYPQSVTEPSRIDVVDRHDGFVHFNYVITSYRDFQRSTSPYQDGDFRLLLIRLFVELFGEHSVGECEVPDLAALQAGLTDDGLPVWYPQREARGEVYRDFRTRLGRALTGEYLGSDGRERAIAALAPFDRHYGYDDAGPS